MFCLSVILTLLLVECNAGSIRGLRRDAESLSNWVQTIQSEPQVMTSQNLQNLVRLVNEAGSSMILEMKELSESALRRAQIMEDLIGELQKATSEFTNERGKECGCDEGLGTQAPDTTAPTEEATTTEESTIDKIPQTETDKPTEETTIDKIPQTETDKPTEETTIDKLAQTDKTTEPTTTGSLQTESQDVISKSQRREGCEMFNDLFKVLRSHAGNLTAEDVIPDTESQPVGVPKKSKEATTTQNDNTTMRNELETILENEISGVEDDECTSDDVEGFGEAFCTTKKSGMTRSCTMYLWNHYHEMNPGWSKCSSLGLVNGGNGWCQRSSKKCVRRGSNKHCCALMLCTGINRLGIHFG